MSIDRVARIVHCVGASIERMKAADELPREMLRRSCWQLALSEELLELDVPIVWHFEAKTNRPSAPSINPVDVVVLRTAASSLDV